MFLIKVYIYLILINFRCKLVDNNDVAGLELKNLPAGTKTN